MTAEEILELIVNCPPKESVDINLVLKQFARRLAAVSHKLTEEEVISLAALASYCFERASNEFVAGVTAEEMIDRLRRT